MDFIHVFTSFFSLEILYIKRITFKMNFGSLRTGNVPLIKNAYI